MRWCPVSVASCSASRSSAGGEVILDYAEACFERGPNLKPLIANRTADALELTNGITLEVRPASFRKLRGPTYIAVIADRARYWYVDAAYANPDVEIWTQSSPAWRRPVVR